MKPTIIKSTIIFVIICICSGSLIFLTKIVIDNSEYLNIQDLMFFKHKNNQNETSMNLSLQNLTEEMLVSEPVENLTPKNLTQNISLIENG